MEETAPGTASALIVFSNVQRGQVKARRAYTSLGTVRVRYGVVFRQTLNGEERLADLQSNGYWRTEDGYFTDFTVEALG